MQSPDRYSEVKRVYLGAERLPKGERSRFIRAQCRDDQELETQVRRLLTVDEKEPDFLEAPALGRGSSLGPGAVLGAFTIVRVLGEGGMGIVYEAEEDEPRRRVALKVIRSGVLSERLRSRFRHEIRVLGQLRHPGIAQIYEAGTLELGGDQVPFFAMELVEGPPLLRFADERGLNSRERLALVAQVCDAVHHAHQKGVIHRDLKPGNILVEESPSTDSSGTTGIALPMQVKVLDFGIARVTDSNTVTMHTEPGQLVGTLPYMSPEQVSGEPDALDIRSDVYAIGVIAFELLAGRLPYAIRDRLLPDAVRMIHETDPTRLGTIDRAFRGDVETIIGKALEKDPRHRYQSAAEMAADIRRYLRDEPIIARPASALYQIRKFARRHRALVAAAGLVFIAMTAATVVSVRQAGIAHRARIFAEKEQGRADRSAETARRQALRATLAAVAGAIEGGDPIAARRLLDDTVEASRGWAWRYWNGRLDQSIAVVAPGAHIAGAWISADGGEVALVTREGKVFRGSPWAVKPTAQLSAGACWAAAFTGDGSRLVGSTGPGSKSLDSFDARTGMLERHIADLPASGRLINISDDAGTVLVGIKRLTGVPPADDVWVWKGDRGQPLRTDIRTSGINLSPNGRWAIFGYLNFTAVDLDSMSPILETGDLRDGLRVAVSDDGTLFAAGGEDKTISVWARGAGSPPLLLRGHMGNITALAFDHAGHRIASAGDDLTIRYWDVRSGQPLAVLSGHTRPIRLLEFCADDSRLMSISDDKTLRLWKPDPFEGVSILRGHSNYVYGAAFTPDGRHIISGSWDQTVRTWDAASGRSLGVMPTGEGFVTAVAVSPDGSTIAAAHKVQEWGPGEISFLDQASGAVQQRISIGRGEIGDMVFSRDGKRLWTAWEHGGAGVMDVMSRQLRVLVSKSSILSIAVSPDETELARGLSGGKILISDSTTGAERVTLSGHTSWITSLSFHPTKRLLASASADGTARLWDLDAGTCRAVLDHHWDKVYATAFSPDGHILATGSNDTTIIIWNTEIAEELCRLRGHEAYVYSLSFSPDGSSLVSASGDHTVRVWDTSPVHLRWRAGQQGTLAEPSRE